MSFRKYVSIAMLLIFSSCSSEPIHIQTANQIARDYSIDSYKNYGVISVGSGGRMMKDVEEIFLAFESYQSADVSKARRLFILLTEGLVDKMNSSSKLRPYLHVYPATYENVDVTLGFSEMDGRSRQQGISYVYQSKGKVIYTENDDAADRLKRVYEEPYEEAVRIVREQEKRL